MLRILTYHRVDDPERTDHLDPALISATPEDFRSQMIHLARWYNPVSLDEVAAAVLHGEPLPRRAVHITFDDAYRDFQEVAWPILRDLGVPVTLFVATAYPGDGARAFWWDRLHRARHGGGDEEWTRHVRQIASDRGVPSAGWGAKNDNARRILRHLPHDEMERLVERLCSDSGLEIKEAGSHSVLDWSELRALADEGVHFGTHTRHHVSLANVDEERIRGEIRGSLDDMERELGIRPRSLAYPYGLWNPAVARIAPAEGCSLGFTCEHGLNRFGSDPLRLRRSTISRRTSPTVFTVRMLPWFARIERWRNWGRNGLVTA